MNNEQLSMPNPALKMFSTNRHELLRKKQRTIYVGTGRDLSDIKDKMNKFKSRKRNRLNEYDYSSEGLYFVTICLNDRKNIFVIEFNNWFF